MRADEVRQLYRSLRWRGFAANLGGALLLFVLFVALDAGDDVPDGRSTELVVLLVVLAAIAVPIISRVMENDFRPVFDDPAGLGRETLLRAPATAASVSGIAWACGALVFGLHSWIRLENSIAEAALLCALICLGGLTSSAVLYLLTERRLRPLFAEAFAAAEPDRVRTVALRPRLLIGWFVGSAVPILFGIALLFDGEVSGEEVRRQALPWLVAALVVGAAVTFSIARALSERVDRLRNAMSKVRAGNLDVRTPVDDASELGLLQAGFNAMVSGLEERERLRDLFGRHVGTEVARAALDRGVSLGGEVAEASALFVDLVGSTTLAATREPTDVVRLLNDVFAAVVAATEEAGGWVNKFEGDAALCVFGPPAAHPDHAARALRAAVALRASLDDLHARTPEIDAGIGVSSGTVVAGNVGAAERYEFTVIGDPVNEAARLTELAKDHPARILASGRTIDAAGTDEGWYPAGSALLRGRTGPTEYWAPAGTVRLVPTAAS